MNKKEVLLTVKNNWFTSRINHQNCFLSIIFFICLNTSLSFAQLKHNNTITNNNFYKKIIPNLKTAGLDYLVQANLDYPYIIQKNSTLYKELTQHKFSGKEINEILIASKPHLNLSKLIPGTHYRLIPSTAPYISWNGIEFKLSPTKFLKITKDTTWTAQLIQKKVSVTLATFTGRVESSLWRSAEQAQMNRELISEFAEIFAWQIDFSRQVNENDTWRLVVEQHVVNGEVVGWGRILAAEYNTPTKMYDAYYYEKPGVIAGYFTKDGKSLAKTLLRTPIEFARITSGFSLRRFHPVLGINRPHLGVDYAAPRGTPIRSVGDGQVLEAHYSVTGGNTLTISHNSVYKTRYLHLNGFAPTVRAGAHVHQGQIVGYVGMTGLSTGPHLHYEFYENNHYKDPLKVDLPPSGSIPKNLITEFKSANNHWAAMLPPWSRTIASNTTTSENSEKN